MPERHWTLCWQALQSLSASADSRAVLLRTRLVAQAVPILRRLLAAAEDTRSTAVLEFFANLTFDLDGQQMLLRVHDGFDTLVDAMESKLPSSRFAAALCLRNVAFAPEGKAAFLARERAIPALLRSLDPASLLLASRAASALWALISRSEKTKVALRSQSVLQQLHAGEMALAQAAANQGLSASEHEAVQEVQLTLGIVTRILGLD